MLRAVPRQHEAYISSRPAEPSLFFCFFPTSGVSTRLPPNAMNSQQLLGVVRALPPAAIQALCENLDLSPPDRLQLLYSGLTSERTREALRLYLRLDEGYPTPPAARPPAMAPPLVRTGRVHRPADSPPAMPVRRLFA